MDTLAHWLFPRHTNNYRSRILHAAPLLVVIYLLFISAVVIKPLATSYPQVLGTSIRISSDQLLHMTNEKRNEEGSGSLVLNEALSKAARAKAQDMFAKNYWAHTSPTGATPWVFIKSSGYQYVYAGENLAKGFTNSEEIVDAWMESKSHRENMLSKNYKDVGFAVMEGKLNNQDTILVVEMFGNTSTAPTKSITTKDVFRLWPRNSNVQGESITNVPLINVRTTSLTIAILVMAAFLVALLLDLVLVEKRKIIRFVGHNVDHMMFLGTMLIVAFFVLKGSIL